MHRQHLSTRPHSQKGFVSIVVSMMIMTILSLITIGFAQIMAREQRQALDRQLSTQAFYAAESGVNDVERAIRTNSTGAYGATCTAPLTISSDASVRNTCITYQSTVPTIEYQSLSPSPFDPRVFPLSPTSGTTASILITFNPSTVIGGAAPLYPNTFPQLLPVSGWTASTGMLKVYLVPFRAGMSRQQLIDATAYYMLYPRSGVAPTSIPFSDGKGAGYGAIRAVNCDATGCRAQITGINLPAQIPGGYTNMYMVVNAVYRPSDIVVDALDTANGSQTWENVQAIVDSTGRTTDVVRRIQVRLPIGDTITSAAGALIATDPAGSICKLYQTSPAGTSADSPCSL